MTTKKPLLVMAHTPHLSANRQAIKHIKIEALGFRTMTLDAGIFYQLRAPSIMDGEEYESRLLRAEASAIGYVVAPDYGINTIWLIVLEDDSLWRWSLVFAADYDAACAEHEWLADVPQLFLVGQSLVDYEADRFPVTRRIAEQGED